MPNWVKKGACPSCGAPIFVDEHKQNSTTPPVAHHTCECRNKPQTASWSWTTNDLVPATAPGVQPLTVGPQPPQTGTYTIVKKRTVDALGRELLQE